MIIIVTLPNFHLHPSTQIKKKSKIYILTVFVLLLPTLNINKGDS